jgi:hypothetical protein
VSEDVQVPTCGITLTMDTEQSVTEAPQEKPLQNVDTVTTVDPPEAAFLHGRALILVTFALLASVFMVALDNAIICK